MRMDVLCKAARLAAMNPREAAYRARERLRIELERGMAFMHPEPVSDDDLPLAPDPECEDAFSFLQYLRGGPAARFYLPPTQRARSRLVRLFATLFPGASRSTAAEAARLCDHRVELLGYPEVHLGSVIDWHRDPITGRRWPRRFWADYDPVARSEAGDAKVILELSRHPHLPRLAKAYYLTGRESLVRETLDQIESWIYQNPPGLGIHWHSSLDIALRALAWMWSLFFVLHSRSLDERRARRIGRSLFAQIDHVCRYPSIYSSPNTHLIGEATALLVAGLVFLEYKRASAWRAKGEELLRGALERQVTREGVHAELSSYYHCYAADFFLQAAVLARRNTFEFPGGAAEKLVGMVEYLMYLARPDGALPLLGDDDGGRVLALAARDYRSFHDAFSTAAVLFGRPDFKHQAGGFREETLWLLGEEGWSAWDRLESTPPRATSRSFPAAGYFIQRSDWSDRAAHACFDAGGLGQPTGGHGHADALSFTLALGGTELLVDPGTFVYNGAPEWRDFFRSTRAHNTAVVDGLDQSEAEGTFRWRRKARARVVGQLALEQAEIVEAEHDGYLALGIVHRRRLLFVRPEYWVVVDDFCGEGEHRFDLYYHFPADASVASDAGGDRNSAVATVHAGDAGLRLLVCASTPTTGTITLGDTSGIQGWISPLYGAKRAAPVLEASMRARAPVSFLTIAVPFWNGPERSELAASSSRRLEIGPGNGSSVACELEREGTRDIFLTTLEDVEIELEEFRMRGEFFWLRLRSGELTRVLAIRARSLSRGGTTVFDHRDPLPYVSISRDGQAAGDSRWTDESLCAGFAG